MLVRAPKAAPEDGAALAAAPRLQNPAASKMLSLVDSLEEELFAAEARRHDAEARHILLLNLINDASIENPAASKMLDLIDRPEEEGSAAEMHTAMMQRRAAALRWLQARHQSARILSHAACTSPSISKYGDFIKTA